MLVDSNCSGLLRFFTTGVPSHSTTHHASAGGMKSLVRLSAIRTFASAAAGATSFRRQNKALSDLIRQGRLREARQLFDSLPNRNLFTWNSMISGYTRHGELSLARKLFDEMPQRDLISWNCMISGYVISYDRSELVEARRLFDQMPERDVISWNAMISGYTRNGKMVEAMQLFGGMPERNVVSWNTVITGFLRVGDIKSAVELFEIMPVQDAASLNALVSGFIQNNLLEEATKILLRSSKASEIEGSVDAFNTLIVGYGRVGRLKEAQSVFDLIPREQHRNLQNRRTKIFQRNVVSWNSMIMCYVKACDLLSARKLFDEMPERDLVSWNTMITGYAQALEMEEAEFLFRRMGEPDARSWNIMMFGFNQKGEVEKARNFFDESPHKQIVTWNTMIAGYEQNGDFEGAIGLFSEMFSAGERFDKHTMSSLLSACSALASLRCGCVIEAMCVFQNMEQRDVISWNSMIGGFAHHGFAMEALHLFEEMKNAKIRPTQITFVAILHACGHAGLVEDGKREFDSMVKEFMLLPNVEHYAVLVDLIGRYGRLDEAMEVIKSMVIPPDRAVWGALLSACRVHSKPDLADTAAEALETMEPNGCASYVLRYNIHADEGRWKEALHVRESMDRKGVFKQPGYSWIELHNKVDVFIAGDCSHPLSEEIYSLIDACNRLIKDLPLD